MFVVQRLKLRPSKLSSFAKSLSVNFSQGKGSKSGTKDVPDEYFNEAEEEDKEFFDIVASIKKDKNLRAMPTLSKPVRTWDHYASAASSSSSQEQGAAAADKEPQQSQVRDQDAVIAAALEESAGLTGKPTDVGLSEEAMHEATFDDTIRTGPRMEGGPKNVADAQGVKTSQILDHFTDAGGASPFIPPEAFNYSIPQYESADDGTETFLDNFIPNSAPEKYPIHAQGLRACEGKAQRHGRSTELRCHLIDLDALNVLDVPTLKRFMTDDGEILGRRVTGLCAKCQRKVATTVKHARNMGMLPHLGQFILRDGKPQVKMTEYHETVAVKVTKHNVKSGKDEVVSVPVKKVLSKTVVV